MRNTRKNGSCPSAKTHQRGAPATKMPSFCRTRGVPAAVLCAAACIALIVAPASGFTVPSVAPLLRKGATSAQSVRRVGLRTAVTPVCSANGNGDKHDSPNDWATAVVSEAGRAVRSSRKTSLDKWTQDIHC